MNITASHPCGRPRTARADEELLFHVKPPGGTATIALICGFTSRFHVKPDGHPVPRHLWLLRRHSSACRLAHNRRVDAVVPSHPGITGRDTRWAPTFRPLPAVAPPGGQLRATLEQGPTITAIQARRCLALFSLFLVPGLTISSWVTRTPTIRDLLGASPSEMDLVLLGLSVGSIAGILLSGLAVARDGAKPVMVTGTIEAILSMPRIGAGTGAGSATLMTAGLFLLGLGMGGGEIAMNVEGTDIEKAIRRPVLPALHGFFSLGTVIGASIGILDAAIELPAVWHLNTIGVVALAILVAAARWIPDGTGRLDYHVAARQPTACGALWKDSRLLLIAAIVLAMPLAEGAAGDWLPRVVVDGHGFGPAMGSAVYAIFAASMTIGRFAGGGFASRFGRAPVLRVSILAGTAGMALVIFVDSQWVAAAAVVLWGLGRRSGSRWPCRQPGNRARTLRVACPWRRPSATSPFSSAPRSSGSSGSTTACERRSPFRSSWSPAPSSSPLRYENARHTRSAGSHGACPFAPRASHAGGRPEEKGRQASEPVAPWRARAGGTPRGGRSSPPLPRPAPADW